MKASFIKEFYGNIFKTIESANILSEAELKMTYVALRSQEVQEIALDEVIGFNDACVEGEAK